MALPFLLTISIGYPDPEKVSEATHSQVLAISDLTFSCTVRHVEFRLLHMSQSLELALMSGKELGMLLLDALTFHITDICRTDELFSFLAFNTQLQPYGLRV